MKVSVFFFPLIFALLPVCECGNKKNKNKPYSVHIMAEIQFVDAGGTDAEKLALYASPTGGEPISRVFCNLIGVIDKPTTKVKTFHRRKKQEKVPSAEKVPRRSAHVSRRKSIDDKKESSENINAAAEVRQKKCEINANDIKRDDIKRREEGKDPVIYLGVYGLTFPDDEPKHGYRIPITKLRSKKHITQIPPKIGLTIRKTGKIESHPANKNELNFWHRHLKHLFGSKDPEVDFAARFDF